jgi:hypothetical protein
MSISNNSTNTIEVNEIFAEVGYNKSPLSIDNMEISYNQKYGVDLTIKCNCCSMKDPHQTFSCTCLLLHPLR